MPQARVKELVGDGADTLMARALGEALRGRAELRVPEQQSRAMELFFQYYREHLFAQSRLYPGTVETLRLLRHEGLRVCCITNKTSRFAIPLLERAGLSAYLEFTLCADRTEDRKPSPTLLLQACRRIEVVPREMLYVGDAHTDVIAAHAAGCAAVAVTYGYHKPGALESVRAEATVASLIEVTDALRLIQEVPG